MDVRKKSRAARCPKESCDMPGQRKGGREAWGQGGSDGGWKKKDGEWRKVCAWLIKRANCRFVEGEG